MNDWIEFYASNDFYVKVKKDLVSIEYFVGHIDIIKEWLEHEKTKLRKLEESK